MSRKEIIDTLENSIIYLDLGNHPGMDRFPREARLMGCVVLTNTRGSAGNETDLPIESEYFKFDDEKSDFDLVIERGIRKVLRELTSAKLKQTSYTELIENAEQRFDCEVKALIEGIGTLPYSTSISEKQVAATVWEYIKERDLLVHERDLLVHERDLLVQINERVIRSLSWRVTRLPRFLSRISIMLLNSLRLKK